MTFLAVGNGHVPKYAATGMWSGNAVAPFIFVSVMILHVFPSGRHSTSNIFTIQDTARRPDWMLVLKIEPSEIRFQTERMHW